MVGKRGGVMDSGCQNENEQCLGGSSMKPRTTEPSRLSLYGGGPGSQDGVTMASSVVMISPNKPGHFIYLRQDAS